MDKLTKKLNQKKYLYTLFLIVSILLVVFINWHPGYSFATGDYRFHINRIEALANEFRHLNFFPKVDGYFSGGMGYAASLFYPDIFLYPSAILRLLHVPILITYWFTMVELNFATFCLTYWAGKRLNFALKNNLIFTFVYTLGTYRLQVLYSRDDFGELMGMMFFPLLLAELIRLRNGKTKQWAYLAIAMSGIAWSHLISLFMAVCFAIAFVLLNLKKFIDLEKIKAIAKAALLTVGVSIAVYAPVIEQMMDLDFTLSTHPLIHIYNETLPISQLFINSANNQPFHVNTVNIGTVALFGLIIYTFVNLAQKRNLDLTIIAWFLFIACSQYFPWFDLRHSIFAMIQFPWRYFSIITLLVAYFIADDGLKLFQQKYMTTALISVVFLLSFGLGATTIQQSYWRLNTYNSYNHISSYLIGAGHEYLPSNVNYNYVKVDGPRELIYNPNRINISDKTLNTQIVRFHFNTNKKPVKVELPLFYYKGYQASVTGPGSSSKPKLSPHGLVEITLKNKGTVTVQYKYTLVQKVSLALSAASLVTLIYFYKKDR